MCVSIRTPNSVLYYVLYNVFERMFVLSLIVLRRTFKVVETAKNFHSFKIYSEDAGGTAVFEMVFDNFNCYPAKTKTQKILINFWWRKMGKIKSA